MTDRAEPGATSTSNIARDRRDLVRGAAINYLGYLLKTAEPVLLLIVVRLYGAAAFGLYAVAQAALLFTARLCVLGLDKGLLWWVPQQDAANARRSVRPALLASGAIATLATVVIAAWLTPTIARWIETPEAAGSLRLMAFGLVPMVLSDVLVHAAMGRRRMEAQVIVKESVLPISLVLAALALYFTDLRDEGLAIAFLGANVLALGAALWFYERIFADAPRPGREALLPPRQLVSYSIPMWLGEMSNSLLQRLDIYIVTAYTDLRIAGVYAVVNQFGNAIRAIRRSFDPIVLAIVAEIGSRHDTQRLSAGFSYATFLVTLTQLPVFVFLIVFAAFIMPLYGPGFEVGTTAVIVLSGFWVVNGATSLAGVVVTAYGHSKLALANVLGAIAVQAAALVVLVPRWGLTGAAVAVGIAYTLQSIAQLVQMRVITGAWHYQRIVLTPIVLGLAGALVMLPALWLSRPWGGLASNITGFATFVVAYGGSILWLWRWGIPGLRPYPGERSAS